MRGVYLWFPHAENNFLSLLPGGGIHFDMGGYYLAALVNMLGPLKRDVYKRQLILCITLR